MANNAFRFGTEFIECTCDHPAADHSFDDGCCGDWVNRACECQWWDEDIPAEYRGAMTPEQNALHPWISW